MTTANFTQISNTKKALAALALTLTMIIPYMLLADTSEPSCSTNPPAGYTDTDCDGRFLPNMTCGTASNPCSSNYSGPNINPYTDDIDDNDPNTGSICDHWSDC